MSDEHASSALRAGWAYGFDGGGRVWRRGRDDEAWQSLADDDPEAIEYKTRFYRGLAALDATAKVSDARKHKLGTGLFMFAAPVYWLVPVHHALTLRGLVGVAILVVGGSLVSQILLAWKPAKRSQPGPDKPDIETVQSAAGIVISTRKQGGGSTMPFRCLPDTVDARGPQRGVDASAKVEAPSSIVDSW